MIAFITMISLTLIVTAISFFSQKFTHKTIDHVQMQAKILRLSLETQTIIKDITALEKDFFLNYRTEGILEANDTYVSAVINQSAQAYETLYEIQLLSTTDSEKTEAAQRAMEAIDQYLNAFLETVEIIKQLSNPEFGELTKYRQSQALLAQTITEVNRGAQLKDAFFQLDQRSQAYIYVPTKERKEAATQAFAHFATQVGTSTLSDADKTAVKNTLTEFFDWFSKVAEKNAAIKEKTAKYDETVQKVEPVILSFLENAKRNEETAIAEMKSTSSNTTSMVLVVGIIAIITGIIIATNLAKGITRQIHHIMALLGEIGMGNFDARVEVVSSDELGSMATTLNAMLDNITLLIQSQEERDHIQNSIMKLLEEIADLTDGDLTARAEVTEDMTGAIADSFNSMAEQFGEIIHHVKDTTAEVNTTSAEVSKLTAELAEKSRTQTEQVEKAVNSIETMVNSIHEVSDSASRSAEVSEQSKAHAREGAEAVNNTNHAMDEIREQINETARSIKRLGESSMEIGNVVQIINDIADRTSILALNASIQAAMAGEAGHGFAVVAEEVQRLSESSSNSTKQIENLIKSIQSEIKDVSNRMDESIAKVVQGSQLADDAHDKLQEIETVSNQLADLISSITLATADQVQVSAKIAAAMQDVGEVSKETSQASQETAKSMGALSTTAKELRQAVETFKVDDAGEILS